MITFHGSVGVVDNPDSRTFCSSEACFTTKRRRRRVAVIVSQSLDSLANKITFRTLILLYFTKLNKFGKFEVFHLHRIY